MKKNIIIKNSIKSLNSVISGKAMVSTKNFYDKRYPPTKFLRKNSEKIYLHCIMCGFPRTGTHWIRQVIEKSTGHKTCNMYEGKPTYVDKKVLLIKIHARSRRIAYVKALLLLPAFKFGGKYIYVYQKCT